MPMAGGDAKRVTDAPMGVQHYAWNPDGTCLAYATADEPANKKDIEKGLDAFEVGNDGYLVTTAPTPSHVWLVTSDGASARRLTSGTWSLEAPPPPPSSPLSGLSWSGDGKSIAFIRQEKPNIGDRDKRSVHVLDVDSKKITGLTATMTNESNATFSPDGSKIAYWHPRDGDTMNNNEVWLTDAFGGKGRSLTRDIDRTLYLSRWMPDGKSLLVGGNDGTRVSLWLQPLEGAAKRLDLGNLCPTQRYSVDATVGKDGAIAFTASASDSPSELYYLAAPGGTPRRLTDFHRELAALKLGKVETLTWKTHDGFQADGLLTFPPDFNPDKKYPLVLHIHGGPASASTAVFSPRAQLMAASGYLVFEPNYRGSDNLGNAYRRAIFRDQGEGPGKDVMAGLDMLKKRPYIDDKRVAVTGWSYGGYMTTWLIGHYQGWKTAIAGAAVTDLTDQYNLSDGNAARRHSYGGSPWVGEHEKFYREQSPITYAKNVKTPTLILATTGDARVTVTQSFKFYHALKDNGCEVKFIAYPVPGHYPADPVRQKDLMRRWMTWLDERLR
jgi:dipeptidyl aminopeptidase/acylaminoacyl peptidase